MFIFRNCFVMIFLFVRLSFSADAIQKDSYIEYLDQFWSDDENTTIELPPIQQQNNDLKNQNNETDFKNLIDELWSDGDSVKTIKPYKMEVKTLDSADSIYNLDEFWGQKEEKSKYKEKSFEERLSKAKAKTCDLTWQSKTCKGDIMCVSHKCFYPNMKLDFSYFAILETTYEYLSKIKDKLKQELALHIKKIIDYGLPKDSKTYEFKITNTLGYECKYYLQNKDNEEIIFKIISCDRNQETIWQLKAMHNGVLEIYKTIAQ